MYIDGLLLFDTASSLAGSTSTDSANVIDLSVQRDVGVGQYPLRLVVQVTTAFSSSSTSNTLQVRFQGSTASTSSGYVTLAETPAFTAAQIGLGLTGQRLFDIEVPRTNLLLNGLAPRYLRLNYLTAGVTAGWSAGAVTAMIVLDRQDSSPTYPPGIAIQN